MLDYYMANHHEMTFKELVRWIKQQFNVSLTDQGFSRLLNRVAAKQVPPVQLPPPDKGKGARLRKQRDTRRYAIDPTGIPTQSSHHFKDKEPGIVASNPDHGGPVHPPRSPGE